MAGYINIQLQWIADWGLTLTEAAVYGYIVSWTTAQGKESALFTADTIAGALSLTNRTVRDVVCSLSRWGAVEVQRRQHGLLIHPTDNGERVREEKISYLREEKISYQERKKFPIREEKISYHTLYNTNIITEGITAPAHTYINNNEKKESEKVVTNERVWGDILLSVWLEHYRAAVGLGYMYNARETELARRDLAPCFRRLLDDAGIIPTEDNIRREIRLFLDEAHRRADQWQKSHWTLGVVTRQFNNLLNTIKNGTDTKNNATARVSTEYVASVLRDAIGNG